MFRCFLVFYAFFVSFSSFSVEVGGIYSAKVELMSRSQSDQDKAIYNAMEMVLVKIAGNKDVLSNSFIRNELQRNSRYLKQFNFVTENEMNKLVATFDEKRITDLFVQQNIPLWGSLRPLVLLWIIKEEGLNRHIISENETSDIQNLISKLSEERGLPIVLPLMDLEDSQNIFISDLWGRFVEPIKLASDRYLAEQIVVIRISDNHANSETTNTPVNCEPLCAQTMKSIDWFMLNAQGDKMLTGETYQGMDEQSLIKETISDITHTISTQYVLATDATNELIIDVANVNSLIEYVELTIFLKKLSSVSDIKLTQVKGPLKRFQLSLMGTQENFFASLKLNNKLKAQGKVSGNTELNSIDQRLMDYKPSEDDPLYQKPYTIEQSNDAMNEEISTNGNELTTVPVNELNNVDPIVTTVVDDKSNKLMVPLFYWGDE